MRRRIHRNEDVEGRDYIKLEPNWFGVYNWAKNGFESCLARGGLLKGYRGGRWTSKLGRETLVTLYLAMSACVDIRDAQTDLRGILNSAAGPNFIGKVKWLWTQSWMEDAMRVVQRRPNRERVQVVLAMAHMAMANEGHYAEFLDVLQTVNET